jgi:hypothetical protein
VLLQLTVKHHCFVQKWGNCTGLHHKCAFWMIAPFISRLVYPK